MNYNLRRIPQTFGFAPAAIFPINVTAILAVIPGRSSRSIIVYLMVSPRGNKRSGRLFRTSGSARSSADSGLRKEQFVHALQHNFSGPGSGPDCRSPSCLMTTSEMGDVAARSNGYRIPGEALRHVPPRRRESSKKVVMIRSPKRCAAIMNPEAGEISPHLIVLLREWNYRSQLLISR